MVSTFVSVNIKVSIGSLLQIAYHAYWRLQEEENRYTCIIKLRNLPNTSDKVLMYILIWLYLQLESERQSQTELKETASSLQLELECVKQELDKKSLSLVGTQTELSTVTEVSSQSVRVCGRIKY